ncbi:Non-classical phosphatidylinositol transfer protein (PITP) [Pleosporales sp. CAS-2024a]
MAAQLEEAPVVPIRDAGAAETAGIEDSGPQAAAIETEPQQKADVANSEPDPNTVGDTATNAHAGLSWPETAPDHPLTKFYDVFEDVVKEAQYDEVFGVHLTKHDSFHTRLVLQKFLRANQNDVAKARQQLLDTLKWRKEFDPRKAAGETFDKTRFGGLGYVLEVKGVPDSKNAKDIATFNIYGAVQDKKATFGDLQGFLRWRVGLMEKSVQKLNLASATAPIPDFGQGPDPYQGFQIHDYLQVSFLRQDPAVKAATAKTIEVLGRYYPETLSRKFFVNVPVIMGWMYTAAKLIVAKETAKKFAVLSYGNQLAGELGNEVWSAIYCYCRWYSY